MKRTFSAVITREGEWFVAQCLEIDVASQGTSVSDALDNLREALELYFEDPQPTVQPLIERVDIVINAA